MAAKATKLVAATVLALLLGACPPAADGNTPPRTQPGGGKDNRTPLAKDGPVPDAGEPKTDDYIAFDGGLKVYPRLKRVELKAWLVGGQSRPLEFFLVAAGGATHESLFTTVAGAEHLKRGLEIIGLNEGKVRRIGRGYFEKPVGDRVKISIRFKHARTGALMVVRAEEWLWDSLLQSTPEKVGFIFTGGHEEYAHDQNRRIVSADLHGNHIALWHDASCILDNDRKHGVVSDCYSPNPDAPGMPPAGAEVTLIFEAEP